LSPATNVTVPYELSSHLLHAPPSSSLSAQDARRSDSSASAVHCFPLRTSLSLIALLQKVAQLLLSPITVSCPNDSQNLLHQVRRLVLIPQVRLQLRAQQRRLTGSTEAFAVQSPPLPLSMNGATTVVRPLPSAAIWIFSPRRKLSNEHLDLRRLSRCIPQRACKSITQYPLSKCSKKSFAKLPSIFVSS
jgi:hypothetical protein